MQELSKLFGSAEKVKLIRFFLSSKDNMYDIDEIEEKLKIKKDILKDILLDLEKSDLVTKSKERYSIEYAVSKTVKSGVREYTCYAVNKKFRFIKALRDLMFDFQNANRDVLVDRFRSIGRCKLFILSGVFTGNPKSRLDILYVGEAIKNSAAEKMLQELNIEIGEELRIHTLDIDEYHYRYKMYDRFLRDVLSEDNEVLIDKIGSYHK